ncbi:nitroreductase [Clostridiales bacterium COT073_COT-073]|nr:nitroreductase [Clostridiales bacterium COT073_COT-073]
MNTESYLSAIYQRCSRRKYINRPIQSTEVQALEAAICKYNESSGLKIQLILEKGEELFGGFRKSYGLLSGVKNYIALVGSKNDPNYKEKIGRYGELLVLEATAMGLSTCWVGGSYDKKNAAALYAENEILNCVIAIGYCENKLSLKERLIGNKSHRKAAFKNPRMKSSGNTPDWFLKGMEAVAFAPSALNLKPFLFHYDNGSVHAELTKKHDFALIDLGIAKLHFELGAGGGEWEYGDGGKFQLT